MTVGLGPHQAESIGSQRQDHFRDLEQKRDREGSVHTTHTSKSQSRGKSHASHEENARNMQKEIDHLKRSLHHKRRRQALSNFDYFSDDEKDEDYRHRSRTPPSKSFSYDEDYRLERRNKNSSSRGLRNDAMSKALNQISKSPLTRWIEEGRLPGGSFNPLSPCIMVVQTLLSMLAILIKRWLYIPRMKP